MRFSLIWIFALLFPLLGAAETTGGSVPADSLGKKRYILATVRVVAEKPGDAIGAVHLVNFAARQEVKALNMHEGLQEMIGVTNTTGTRDESNLRIRGFRKNELKILVDGRPLNGGYFGNVNLHQLAPAGIREIQVVKGPGSAVYGPGTMGGVVNIITADPDTESWLELDLLAKRNNSNRLAISSDRRIGDLGYHVYLAREHSEGMVLPEDFEPTPFENGGVRDHSKKTQYDLQTRLDYSLSDFRQLGASAGISYVPEKLIPSSIYSWDHRLYKDWMHHWGTLEYEDILSGSLKFGSHLYYDGGQDTYQQFDDPAHEHMTLNSEMRYYTLGFNPRLEWVPDKRNTLSSGLRVEYMHNTRKDDGPYPEWTPHWMSLYNAFCQWKHQISEVVSFNAGLGLSSHQSDLNNTLSLFLEPSAGILFKFNELSESSVSLGRNTSFPTMRQLFSSSSGNPGLKPQHALKFEIDHRQGTWLGNFLLNNRISLYFNDMRDLIDRQGADGIYQNFYRVRSWGMEYSLLWRPAKWWESEAGYSFLFWESDGSYELTETPRNQVSLSQNWKLPWQLGLGFTSTYTDSRFSQGDIDEYHTLGSHWLHDLAITRKFGQISVSLGLENIFDTHYETEYGYPGAGLNFFINLKAEI
ncbi:MAG: TonB-dependent receptor plug domain-containing protein [Candidatus Syntrophosphaera sp.]